MPSQRKQSAISQKIGKKGRDAHDEHIDDDIEYSSGGELPEGIEFGVAQLTKCEFGEYKSGPNEGEPFFIASGVVVEPKEHNGINIEGRHTQIGPEALCDTPDAGGKKKTFDDHYKWFLNQVKMLGLDKGTNFDDMEDAMEALVEEEVHFRFRTWKGKATEAFPNPRVNHSWEGSCQYNGEVSAEVVDNTSVLPRESADADSEDVPFGDELDALGDKAEDGDTDAIEKLREAADAVGINGQLVDDAKKYTDVVEMIRTKTHYRIETRKGDTTDDDDNFTPEKGVHYKYKPKGKRKSIEMEVITISMKKETVTLKDPNTEVSYTKVPWSDLQD